MLLQSYFYFPVLNRKTIYRKFIFLAITICFQTDFVFNDGQIIECEELSFRGDESPMALHN